jgi:hypothetical protein
MAANATSAMPTPSVRAIFLGATPFVCFSIWTLSLSAESPEWIRRLVFLLWSLSASFLAFAWQKFYANAIIAKQEKAGLDSRIRNSECMRLNVRTILVAVSIFLHLMILALPLGRF